MNALHRSLLDPAIAPGHYRLGQGVHIHTQRSECVALCDYPLRVVRLTSLTARLLSLCQEERTVEELATLLKVPQKSIATLCEQLRWKSLLETGTPLPPTNWPSISIVIPSYNRANELQRCIHSLFALDYPQDALEIIVVDDASADNTPEMLNAIAHEVQLITFHVIRHKQRRGVAAARNTGTEVAAHDIIAYIDSDCVASTTWLKELVPYLQDEHVAMVGGEIRAYNRSLSAGRYEDVRSSLYMGPRTQQVRREGPLTYLPTANLLIRKVTWQQLGGFMPLTQGEDVDFCRRMLAKREHILYVPYGTVYHDYRTQLRAFLGIRAAYATAEAVLLARHPSERRILVLPPEQASFAGLLIGALWGCLRLRSSRFARLIAPVALLLMLLHVLLGTNKRRHKLRPALVSHVATHTIFVATLRGHLAYTYHLCRHLTRYYTLPLLIAGLFLPPLLPLAIIICGIVIGVDYVRFKPNMNLWSYAFYALLDDCAYEWGVVKGCVKQKTWKPLLPVVKNAL